MDIRVEESGCQDRVERAKGREREEDGIVSQEEIEKFDRAWEFDMRQWLMANEA
jgi:hypothetical protein